MFSCNSPKSVFKFHAMFMKLSLQSNFCVCVHSKRETCLKTDSRVFSEEISLKQDNL